jgi:GcrA cell cycle regulator
VLGNLHRLGLLGSRPKSTARPPRVKPPATLRRRRDPPARAQIAEVARSPLPEGPGLVAGVRELRPRCCRWPIGDPRSPDFTFCGRQTGSGPYCPAHRRLAYRPAGAAGAADAA